LQTSTDAGDEVRIAPWVQVPAQQAPSVSAAADAARSHVKALVGRADAAWQTRSARVVAWGSRWSSIDLALSQTQSDATAIVEVTLSRASQSSPWRAVSVDRVAAKELGAFAATAPLPLPPDVGGNQDLGAIVGTGALLLPGTFDGDASVRQDAANCPDCEWRKRTNCSEGVDNLCTGAFVGCPAGQVRFQILLRRPPATDFAVVGTICLGGGQQLRTADQLAADVRDRFIELLPRAGPTFQPQGGALVNLPALFSANEPAVMGPIALRLSGYDISLTAAAQWRWTFGDGQVLVTERPGGAYPDRSVQHTYSAPGRFTVALATTWSGEFSVDGAGPFPVGGDPVTLSSSVPLAAREAGARLLSTD